MQTTVTVDGEHTYTWRSGFELFLAYMIASAGLRFVTDAGYSLTGFVPPSRSVSAADFLTDAVGIGLLLVVYWWLRRRNARRSMIINRP